MRDFFDIKKLVCRISGKCSTCGDTLTMSNRNKSLCVSCEWAREKFSDKKELFKMQMKDGVCLNLSYLGYTRYSPNRSSTSGYGSDEWMYLCEEKSTHYLLMFSDDASCGTCWMCTELLKGDYENLLKKDVRFWVSIAYSEERTKRYAIHLMDVESVRHLLPTSSRCCGNLTDEHYLR